MAWAPTRHYPDSLRNAHPVNLTYLTSAGLGLCSPGSLVERTTRCGSPRCRCHTDPSHLHGPYPSWIRKIGAKTVTRTLSPAQLERYRHLSGNTKRLRELISELEMLSAEVVEQAEGWTRT